MPLASLTAQTDTGASLQSGGYSKFHYILCLDGVRAASIILVILAHTAPLGPKAWLFNAMAGRMGMALFFCLSGFLIVSMLYNNPDVPAFLTKRVLRIVPALFLYLVTLLVFFDLPLQSFVLNLVFLSNYVQQGLEGGPVGHLWSLCVEMHFYVLISLAVLVGGRKAVWLVIPGALAITVLRIDSAVVSNIMTHLRADEILVGGWLALASFYFREYFTEKLSNPILSLALISILLLAFMVSAHDHGGAITYLRPYIAMCLVGAVMFSRIRWLLKILESQIAQYVARISYALYIWHPLMVMGVMNTGSSIERYLVKRPVSWTLTLIAAHLSTSMWESKWQRFARWLLRGRR